MFAILPIIIVSWLNIQCIDGFGISSFGKANTDPPKPATTSAAPGKNLKQYISYKKKNSFHTFQHKNANTHIHIHTYNRCLMSMRQNHESH